MNVLYSIAVLYIPSFLKKRELLHLFGITASAFSLPLPSLAGLSYDECLQEFARFSESAVQRSYNRKSDMEHIKEHLFQGAYRFGKKYKKLLSISSRADAWRAARLLYRILKIDFRKVNQGPITISRCFFSEFYSPDTCRVFSSLDAGVLAGLSGGGVLQFTQRITEGSDCCLAQLIFKDESL